MAWAFSPSSSDGWIGALNGHMERSGRRALVTGFADGGLFGRKPFGVLVERDRLKGRRGADLKSLRRELGLRPRRIG